MRRWHLLTPEYPPACGGVGDYTALVAAALAEAGDDVHVWYPAPPGTAVRNAPRLTVHPLPDRFGRRSRALVAAAVSAAPGVILAEYVPGAFGASGLNLPFCRWLARLHQRGADVRVMFHEPFFYFGVSRPWRNGLALVQRLMAFVLLRASTRVYSSTDAWVPLLRPYAPHASVEVLPIPSTIPSERSADAPAGADAGPRAPFVIGHFGTYGEHVGDELVPVLPAILRRVRDSRARLIGSGSTEFARQLPADVRDRIEATGRLAAADVAAALHGCDLLVQPYPDGVTTRRTSVMSGLACGTAVLTTTGRLTEKVWADSAAVALAPAGDAAAMVDAAARLAGNPEALAALAARGRALYDEAFGLPITIARMRR